MYQQSCENKKGSSTVDVILIIALIAVIILIRRLVDLAATLPNPFNYIGQAAIVIVAVALCYLLYTRRITHFRYSIIYKQVGEGEENIFGQQQPYPWPEGTVLIERMVAEKGKLLEKIDPDELVELSAPGEAPKERVPSLDMNNFTGGKRDEARILVYRRRGKLCGARLSPDETMAGYIAEAVNRASAAR